MSLMLTKEKLLQFLELFPTLMRFSKMAYDIKFRDLTLPKK